MIFTGPGQVVPAVIRICAPLSSLLQSGPGARAIFLPICLETLRRRIQSTYFQNSAFSRRAVKLLGNVHLEILKGEQMKDYLQERRHNDGWNRYIL